jgi:hypothetical protein
MNVLDVCSLVVAVFAVIALRSRPQAQSTRVEIAVFVGVFVAFKFGVPLLLPFIGWLFGFSVD